MSRAGKPLAIEPLVFDLLVYLVENKDRILSREDIIEAVWDGRFVSDAAVSSAIKSLRQVLGDDGDAQRVIRTVRGRGFRFVASLEAVPFEAPPRTAEPALPAAHAEPALQSMEPLTPKQDRRAEGKPSIAVLPFQTLAGEANNKVLAEALPHELIQSLSKLRWLRVIARGSTFRLANQDVDLSRISALLSVRYALQGSVSQIGQIIFVNVELSDCQSHNVVWPKDLKRRSTGYMKFV